MEPVQDKYSFRDRRKGPDGWIKFLHFASALAWGILLLVLLIMDKAKPEFENFFSRIFHVTLRLNWDVRLLNYAFYLSLFMFGFSLFAHMVNRKRSRRKSDRYSKSIIMAIFFSLGVIIFYFYKT